MSFDFSEEENGAISQINVTPLVDVMLVLLIIFMVSAPMMTQGIELNLPKETIAPIKAEGEESQRLTVSIDKGGRVYLGAGNEVEMDLVGNRVAAILTTREDKSVYVKADKDVPYGVVMAAMARIRRAGIYKVGLITDPSTTNVEVKPNIEDDKK